MSYWELTVLHYNALGRRFDYKKTWSKRMPHVASLILVRDPDVVTLVECGAAEARELANRTGYRVSNYLGSTILTRPGLKVRTLKRYSWLKNYPHSAVVIEVKNEKGVKVNVAASHLPPFAYRAGLRKKQMKILCELFKGWSDATIIGTDANWYTGFESFVKGFGFTSAGKTASEGASKWKTASKISSQLFKSGNPIDFILGKPGKTSDVVFNVYSVLDGRKLPGGDHNPIQAVVTCGKVPDIPPAT